MPIRMPPKAEPPTKEVFFPVTYSTVGISYYNDYPGADLGALNDAAQMALDIPNDFHSIVAAEILVIPRVTQAACNWDIWARYGKTGQNEYQNTESDTATTYSAVAGVWKAVNIAGILTALEAGDHCGIRLGLGDAAHDVFVYGVRLRYN